MKKILLLTLFLFFAYSDELKNAYLKEYTFLEAQKEAMTSRSSDLDRKYNQQQDELNSKLNAMQNNLVKKTGENAKLEEELFLIQKERDTIMDEGSMVDSTIAQASSTLENYKLGVESTQPDEKLAKLLENANLLLGKLSSITTEHKEYFLSDGKKTSGNVVTIGNIASYATEKDKSGVLAPAGEGFFKVVSNEGEIKSSEEIADMLSGKSDTIEIFFYESTKNEASKKEGRTLWETIKIAGYVGYVIVLLGIVSIYFVGYRIYTLKIASKNLNKITQHVVELVEKKKIDKAIDYCKEHSLPVTRVLKSALSNIENNRTHLDDIVTESLIHEGEKIDKYSVTIIVVAAVSPLLGLLGTVTGMIGTFEIITTFGTSDPKLLTEGISEALVATEFGLIVAIPTLALGNLLSGWAENIKNDIEKSSLQVINTFKSHKG